MSESAACKNGTTTTTTTTATITSTANGKHNQDHCHHLNNGTNVNTIKQRVKDNKKGTPQAMNNQKAAAWRVKASDGALNTSNPIREIIETMNLAENPAKKVIPLSIGDPTIFGNLKPCKEILESIQRANASGKFYGYQTAAGMESAREAVAEYHHKCTGNRVKLQDVILSSGCSHAIDLCICVLARRGQNILIPRPGFPLYKTLTAVYGVQYKQYNLIAEKNWSIDLEHLESLIDENTAAIVINNPSNPCGSVFSKQHLMQILRLAEKFRLPIIADEIYDKFVFTPDGTKLVHEDEQQQQQQQPDSHSQSSSTIKQDIKENRQPTTDYISAHPAVKMVASNESVSLTSDLESSDEHDQFESGRASGECYSTIEDLSGSFSDIEDDDDDDEDDDDYEPGDDGDFKYVPFKSLASLSETVPILTCGGISKTCLIPGLRLGWIIINDKRNIFDSSIRFGLSRLTQRLMGPNSLVQGALRDILANVPEHFYKSTMDFIFSNAKLCYRRLLQVRGLQPYMPQGSMYLMVRFNPKLFPNIDGDLDFTSKLMNEESVLVLPGKCFDFPNFFRVCLTVPTNVMEEALNRIQEFCERHAIIEMKDENEISNLSADDNLVVQIKQLKAVVDQSANVINSKQQHEIVHHNQTPNGKQRCN